MRLKVCRTGWIRVGSSVYFLVGKFNSSWTWQSCVVAYWSRGNQPGILGALHFWTLTWQCSISFLEKPYSFAFLALSSLWFAYKYLSSSQTLIFIRFLFGCYFHVVLLHINRLTILKNEKDILLFISSFLLNSKILFQLLYLFAILLLIMVKLSFALFI